ncbi:Flagellar transcriptional regulator FlhD [compost metagenome]|uniref:Flagellar transcriptional regulator FlhD n=1 Tax=Achromobacter agilis TaxID=1353888 RepID=A0A446CGC4_9BURK|nr:flagellar transcriptional regulator FlhD [Achromobacter agilis]SSW66920.1 Flagellar transcriptional regulator FlhD [Achromobacter agilis]
MPKSTELLRDIHETNLMYLLLLQRLAREGNTPALGGTPVSEQACRWLAGQGREALVKLAQSSVLLARLDLPPHLLLSALSQGLDTPLAGSQPAPAAAPARS